MNLNRNPRFEQFDLDDDAEIADFLAAHAAEMEDLMPEGTAPRHTQVSAGFRAALGGGMAEIPGYDLDKPADDDGPVDMSIFLAPAKPLELPAAPKPLQLDFTRPTR